MIEPDKLDRIREMLVYWSPQYLELNPPRTLSVRPCRAYCAGHEALCLMHDVCCFGAVDSPTYRTPALLEYLLAMRVIYRTSPGASYGLTETGRELLEGIVELKHTEFAKTARLLAGGYYGP